MDGAGIVGAAGGAASMLPGLFGRGKNEMLQTGFVGKAGYDKNAPFYGGRKGALADYTKRQRQKANAADSRAAFQADYSQDAQARLRQGQVAEAMRRRAMGQTPSIASMEAARNMQQATAAQASAAASARGPAAMALAQQNAAANTANAQSAISNQAQINAANERMQAEQASMGAYSNIRGQDSSNAQFQAQMQQANRAANDQRAMGHEQMQARAIESELQARTSNQAALAQAQSAADQANQRTADQNAQSKGVVESIGDFFGSDERMKVLLPGGGGMVSDTQAKRAAVLAQGRKQGAAAAKGGPSLDQMLDDRTKGPDYGANADDAALNDRQQQFSDRGIGKEALDKAIGDQVAADRQVGDSAMEQWKRSFGDPDDARASVRNSDNQAEASRIRARFGDSPRLAEGGTSAPPQATWWSALGGAGKSLSDAQFAPPRPMVSDENAKVKPTGGGGIDDTMAKLHQVHDIKGVGSLNADAMKQPGIAKAMAPGSPVANDDDDFASAISDMRGKDIVPLMDSDEGLLQQGEDGRAYYKQRLEAPPVHPAFASSGKSESKPTLKAKVKPAQRKKTPEELLAEADKMKADMTDDFERYTARGPAVGGELSAAQRDANRSMAGSPYAYKPGLTPNSQKPGELNFGPMAQNMEQSPVAGTAVKEDPGTGLKVIDRDKALKVVMSGVADLQKQQDETRALLAAGGRRKR